MQRADAEKLGWIIELGSDYGHASKAVTVWTAKRVASSETIEIAVNSDDPEPALLANIAEREGTPIALGYGLEPSEDELAAEVAILQPTLEEKLAVVLEHLPDGPISKKDLADVIATLRGDA